MMTRLSFTALLCGALVLAGCERKPAEPQALIVGAAANLMEAAQALGAAYQKETGTRVTFSFASTAQLASQIENGAPFDVFLAADAQHVDQLDQKGLLVKGSDQEYARGALALWIPDAASPVQAIGGLASAEVRSIAVAKPELAPYGAAAVEALKRAGLWNRVQDKIVYAENISMARQFGTSKNAGAVFTAYSLVLHEGGRVIRVDPGLYAPIVQKLGVLASSRDTAAAGRFARFVAQGEGRKILAGFGYQ